MDKESDNPLDLNILAEDFVFALDKSMKGMSKLEVAALIIGSNLFPMISSLMNEAGKEYQAFKDKFPEKFPEKKDRILKIVED